MEHRQGGKHEEDVQGRHGVQQGYQNNNKRKFLGRLQGPFAFLWPRIQQLRGAYDNLDVFQNNNHFCMSHLTCPNRCSVPTKTNMMTVRLRITIQ